MAAALAPRAGVAYQSSSGNTLRHHIAPRRIQRTNSVVSQSSCPVSGQDVPVSAAWWHQPDERDQRLCRSSIPSGLVGQRWGKRASLRRDLVPDHAAKPHWHLHSQLHWPSFSIFYLPPGSAHSLELRPTASHRDEGCVIEKFRCVELRKSEFVFIGNWSNSCLTNVLHPLRVLRSHLADAPDTEIRITSISAIMQNIRWRCACCPTFFLPDG